MFLVFKKKTFLNDFHFRLNFYDFFLNSNKLVPICLLTEHTRFFGELFGSSLAMRFLLRVRSFVAIRESVCGVKTYTLHIHVDNRLI